VLPGLKPLRGRARWAVGAVAVVMLADVVTIWSDLLEIDLMNRLIDDGEEFQALSEEAFEDVESNDDRQLAVVSFYSAAYIAAIVFFLRWFWSAYWNLGLLGQPGTRYNPAWAIVSWFIPIFNAWRPKQIANDIWRGSDPDATAIPHGAWKDIRPPLLLGAWWGFWLVSSYVANVALRTGWDPDTPEEVETAAQLDLAASATDFVAGVLVIPIILQLTARQQARTERLAAAPPPPPPPLPDTIPAA
jgi:Domain of unknown function (DUF4328)